MGKDDTKGPVTPEEVRISLRQAMPISRSWAYFDHGAVAPLPAPTAQAISTWLEQACHDGDTRWLEWSQKVESLRSDLACLVHATSAEIALVPNTSTGISLVAEGLDWKPGDNVVVPSNEFPSNLLPWKNLKHRGVEIREVEVSATGELTAEMIMKVMDRRTKLVSVSWVGFSTGFRCDLHEICSAVHKLGALFFVDAIQGMGVFPLELDKIPIDFLAADGHKWMLGPEGAGMLFVRDKHLERLRMTIVGWGSVPNAGQFSASEVLWKKQASRFEAGSQNMSGMIGFGASVRLLLEHGAARPDSPLADSILDNVDDLVSRLERWGWTNSAHPDRRHRSGIVSWIPGTGDPQAVRLKLLEQKVVTSVRLGQLRASIHAYNNGDDLDRLFEALAEVAGRSN